MSSFVYVVLTVLSMLLFHEMMMRTVDNNLNIFSGTVGRAIAVHDGKPYFRDWLRTVQTEPNRSIVTMQLYDKEKQLLESYGPKRYEQLVTEKNSISFGRHTLRIKTSPIVFSKTLIGYIQTELDTDAVEDATQRFALTMVMIAPLVIAGLAATSRLVSGQVARPYVEGVTTLRRFIGDAGHELNTPLSIVKARAESMANKMSKQGLSTKELDIIMGALERMNNIVSDLMLLTEVEGRLANRASETKVELDRLAAGLVEEFKEKYAQKKVLLTYEPATATVSGYPDALQRLISNLLDNALKYTETGGQVKVRLTPGDRQVHLIVEDTGMGIPPESLPHVFDRFYRVDKSRSRASGGVGLGLSIVKAIAEAHQGSVTVESAPGSGTRFSVNLPCTS
jgi:OmpR-family two-component system manganese-sensing sensor histidine kinase